MGWIGVDMDGTLSDDRYKKSIIPGPPIEKMVERVKTAIQAGKDVRIFTARVCGGEGNFEPLEAKSRIYAWCELYLGQILPVTCRKDQHMDELWDDKARGIIRNTGEFADVRFGPRVEFDPPQVDGPLTDSGANRIVPADPGGYLQMGLSAERAELERLSSPTIEDLRNPVTAALDSYRKVAMGMDPGYHPVPVIVDLRDPKLTPTQITGRILEGVQEMTDRALTRAGVVVKPQGEKNTLQTGAAAVDSETTERKG